MDFSAFVKLEESTVIDLYKSTVNAFPKTTKRQNSIDLIKIIEMNFTPYLGVKTLFVKGLAKNIDNQKEYTTLAVFKGINYLAKETRNSVKLIASNEKKYILETIKPDVNEVLVRCDCPDFYWRFNYYNSIDKSLYGRKRRKYESSNSGIVANEKKAPGMCKHLIKMIKALNDSKIMEV
jgi:hypothetical protein